MGSQWILNGSSDRSHRRLVADEIHAMGGLLTYIDIPNIALNKFKIRMRDQVLNIFDGTGRQIIQHPHLAYSFIADQGIS